MNPFIEKREMSRYRPFIRSVPISILLDFLEPYCGITDNMLVVNDIAYRKMIQDDANQKEFRRTLLSFYQPAKHYYVSRDFTYASLTTIIRHICNLNSHPYTSKLQYEHSQHYIIYFVECGTYLSDENSNNNNNVVT
jgi:hypothetical protein|tara:strand:- start:770 stop:1180 length:411 start_codon:yes stop_codon:yes gene_type:complete